MSLFAEINISNTNLTGGSFTFDVYIKDCNASSWNDAIKTGLTISDFPQYINIESTLGDVSCYDYKVQETITSVLCSGTTYIDITPTPTSSITPTPTPSFEVTSTPTNSPTPTVTPSGDVSIDVLFGVEYSSGSTIANFTFTASTIVKEDLIIDFKNTIYRLNGDEVPITSSVTILQNNRIGTSSVILSGVDYNDIRPYELSYTDISSNRTDVIYNKYSKVVFDEKPSPTKYVNYLFRPCCSDGTRPLNLIVTEESLQPSGWVGLGFGVLIDKVCYLASEPGGDGSDGYYYGPDIKSCDEIYGCPPCTTPKPTRTPTTTPTNEFVTPTPTPTPSSTYVECFVDPSVNVTPNPYCEPLEAEFSVTPNPTNHCVVFDPQVNVTPNPTPFNNQCFVIEARVNMVTIYGAIMHECCANEVGNLQTLTVNLILTGNIDELSIGDSVRIGDDYYNINALFIEPNSSYVDIEIGDEDIFVGGCDYVINNGLEVCYTNLYQGCNTNNIYALYDNNLLGVYNPIGQTYHGGQTFGDDFCATSIPFQPPNQIIYLVDSLNIVSNCSHGLCGECLIPEPVSPTPTTSPTPTPTPTPYPVIEPTVLGGFMYLSGMTTGQAFKLDEESLISHEGQLYQGFGYELIGTSLFNVGDMIEGNMYLTSKITPQSANIYDPDPLNYRPEIINGQMVTLPYETYLVITEEEYYNNKHVLYNIDPIGFIEYGLFNIEFIESFGLLFNTVAYSPVYRYETGTEKIIYEFNLVNEPTTSDIIIEGKTIKVYVNSSYSEYLDELNLLFSETLEFYSNSNLIGPITEVDFEVLTPDSPIQILDPDTTYKLYEYYYYQGGAKTITGFDYIFYVTDNPHQSLGMGQISGPIMLIFLHHADFENNYEQSLSTFSFTLKHELGHNLGVHHTFTCGWYAYTNGINGDTPMLDNITFAAQSLCNDCFLSGLLMPYSAETESRSAIMSYRSTEFLGQCEQPENHTVLIDQNYWPEEFYVTSNYMKIPAFNQVFDESNEDCNVEVSHCNYPFNNINYYNFVNNDNITEIPTYGKISFKYVVYEGNNCPIQFKVYITHEGNNLIEVLYIPQNQSQNTTIFNYEFTESELEQIFNISDYTKIGVKFEAKVLQLSNFCSKQMRIFNDLETEGFESTLSFKFGDTYYQPKSEYSIIYTNESGTEIDYTYNLPYGRFYENVTLYNSYERIAIDVSDKLRKNYYQ